jgi:glycosyltransferase involved in cell wall biosynthesis
VVGGSICVSVIIPALNEEAMIGRCLGSLIGSKCPTDGFEVILVDNGSTDHTLEVARSFSGHLNLTILQRPCINISGLRNEGAAAAKGEILAFLDADCLVPSDWIVNACCHLSSEGAGVIGGNIDIPGESRWVARAWYGIGYAPRDGEVTYVPSGNMLMRRSSFRRIGGFDESLKTSEDCELCFRAKESGMTVRAIGEMAVIHVRTPQTLTQFYLRERWHGTHVVKVFLANIKARPNLRAVVFAFYMLVCGAVTTIGLVLALFFGQYVALSIGVGGVITVPLLCSVRKLRAVRGKKYWATLIPLTVLHMVWGFARARALLSFRTFYHRATAPESGT